RHILSPVERLKIEKPLGKGFEILALLRNDPCCVGKTRLYQTAHFSVDFLRGGFGDRLLAPNGIAEENLVLIVAIHDCPKLFREAPTRYHSAGELGRLFNVGLRAGRYDLHAQFLAYLLDDRPNPLPQGSFQNLVAILRYPHDMVAVVKNGVTSVVDFRETAYEQK